MLDNAFLNGLDMSFAERTIHGAQLFCTGHRKGELDTMNLAKDEGRLDQNPDGKTV